jgi:hypothetical protein
MTGKDLPVRRIVVYALISLAAFLCGAALLATMIWNADALTRFGLIGQVFYPVLVIFGLCAAVCLFGVLQSYATYRGRHFGGVLEMGGPAVVFALVVIGGKLLVPDVRTFSLAIYVHGPNGPQDVVLRNSGMVALDLDERVTQQIGDKGQAVFPAVPAKFRDQEVAVSLQSDVFETSRQIHKLRLTPPLVYLPVDLRMGHIDVHVTDVKGEPVSDAEIRVESQLLGKTNAEGDMKSEVALTNADQNPKLRVQHSGYQPWSAEISVYGTKQIEIQLTRDR